MKETFSSANIQRPRLISRGSEGEANHVEILLTTNEFCGYYIMYLLWLM